MEDIYIGCDMFFGLFVHLQGKVKLEYHKQLVTSFLFKYNIGSKYFADVGIRGSLVSKATK